MLNFFKKKPDVFWSWFAANEPRLREDFHALVGANTSDTTERQTEVMDIINRLMGDLHSALAVYDKKICPYGGIGEDGVIELIFTAEGDASAFPRVFELVAAAAEVPGWRFIPLKPAQTEGATAGQYVEVEDLRLDFGDIEYVVAGDDYCYEILMLVDTDVTHDFERYQFLAHLAAETHLGEYVHATHVDNVHLVTRHRVPAELLARAQPIQALAAEFPKELAH